MRLDYFMPSAGARDLLTIHAAVEDVAQARAEILPAMLPNIYIRFAGSSSLTLADGRTIPAPRVTLIGPTASAYSITLGVGCRMAVVGLMPQGWARLVRVPGWECADGLVDGTDIWGEAAVAEVTECLALTPMDGNHIGLVEAFLARTEAEVPHHLLAQLAMVDQWLEHSRSLSLDVLGAQLDVGARQLRRITLEGYGVSPKTLAMKYRALRTAALMSQGKSAQVEAALQVYADQSHLIRDFRRFVGWTPAAFLREPGNVAAATLSGRRLAGATRPLVLLS